MKRSQLAFIIVLLSLAAVTSMRADRLYLSGMGPSDARTWDFFCSEGQNSGKWKKIQVPSCWELQGFGDYTYGRFYKTKGLRPSCETGTYRTVFKIPADWAGRIIRLTFEGVMTDTHVCINGKSVGTPHQGGFTEFTYDITDYVTPGKRHKLEVTVKKESDNSSVNSAERRADWWLFGGIYRPVYIESLPKNHIENLVIDARADGCLYISPQGLTLSLEGKQVPFDSVAGCFRCPGVTPWDPEHPRLYEAVFSLPDGSHCLTEKIGFRTVEFRPHDGIYLNGTKLVVKGINRHCFHPESGRAVDRSLSLLDARLIKKMNMNAVRSHYPPDRHFLDICDSIGLLYIDEFPGWQTAYDDTTARRMLPEFIRRDVNHPCVFLWSNGNEGGWNTSVDSLFYSLDPQRRRVIHPWSDFDGIDTHHYPAYQTGVYRMQNGQNVFMPTEFLHSKYDKGGGASLEDMWSHWTRSPLFAGGFIWAYADEAVRRTDLGGILDSDGGNGPDGVVDPYRNPEGSFFTIREVWSPVYIDRFPVTPGFDGGIAVENRSLFSNLDEYRLDFSVRTLDGASIDCGNASLPGIAPGERAFATVPVCDRFFDADILELAAVRKIDGDTVCSWSTPLHRAEDQCVHVASQPVKLQVSFNDDGTIGSIEKNGIRLPLNGGPLPVGMLADCCRHTERVEAGGDVVNTFFYTGGIDSIQWRQTPDGRLLMDAVVLNDERGHGYKGKFLTENGNWQLGLTFNYPEEIFASGGKSVTYLGDGPYRVWRNRLKGSRFGVWTKEYNNSVTGQYNSATPPVYPEFKGYHSNVYWMQFPDFRVTSLTDGLFVRLYTPEEAIDETPGEMGGLDEGKRRQERTMVDFPAGDISFLLSIPPMRSYKPLDQLGPSAVPDNIRIKKGDEGFHIRLIFDFSDTLL